MKISLILIGIVLYVVQVKSQPSFIKTYTTTDEEIPFCIEQIGDSYYVGLRTSQVKFGYNQSSKLLKINNRGETQAERDFVVTDSNYFNIVRLLSISDTELLAAVRYRQQSNNHAQICVMKIDTSLQVIWERKYELNQPSISNIDLIENNNGNILIGTAPCSGSPLWNYSLLFLEINKYGDSLQSNYFSDGNPRLTEIYSLIQINNQYKAFVTGYNSFTNNNCFSEILQLDSSLNLLEVRPVPYIIQGYMTADKIDDSHYYHAGMAYSSATHYDVGIAKLTNTEDSIAYNHAGEPGVAVDYSGWMKCMSVSNTNSIYTGGTGNDNGDFYNCHYTNKVLMLSNYDSLLNCRWTRFYGSDTACYTMSTLEATSDGGCIMGGMYYTPDYPENLLDAVIIKVDSMGLFTSMPNYNPISIHEANIYPNPGQDYLVIQSGPQINGAIFRLYDAAGNLVEEKMLYTTIERIDASQLSRGTYLWQILSKNKLVDYGKWIKQ